MTKRLSKKEFAKQKQTEMKETIQKAMGDVAWHMDSPEGVKEYLDFMAKMHDYSPRNQMLLQNQYKGAHGVAGKKHFEEMGFNIREGEKPLQVLAPVFKKYTIDKDDKWIPLNRPTKDQQKKIDSGEYKVKQKLHYYKFADVYDLGQTDAKTEDYPKIFPNRPFQFDEHAVQEKYPDLKASIKQFAENQGFHLKEEQTTERLGNAKGAYYPDSHVIRMRPQLSDGEYISTLNHEMAHGQLHRESTLDTPTKELEAEMTAYVTNKHFGLDTSEKSISYMASWTENLSTLNDKETFKVIERVSKASRSMIDGIEKEYEKEQEQEIKQESKEAVENLNKDSMQTMNIYREKDGKREYFDYKELENHDIDIFKNVDQIGFRFDNVEFKPMDNESLSIKQPLWEYRDEKENYEALEILSKPSDIDSPVERRNIFELENATAKDYVDQYYLKSYQMADASINSLNNQLILYGNIDDDITRTLKEDTIHAQDVKNDINRFLESENPEYGRIRGNGGSTGVSFDPKANLRVGGVESYKSEILNAGFTTLEQRMMEQIKDTNESLVEKNNIQTLKVGDMRFNYQNIKSDDLKDFTVLKDADHLGVEFESGEAVDFYKNTSDKRAFNKAYKSLPNNKENTIENYVQYGLNNDTQAKEQTLRTTKKKQNSIER